MISVRLKRNLRRSILQGHPWIYLDSLAKPPSIDRAQLCQVFDAKDSPLAWAIYDPHSVLRLRVLSTSTKPPKHKTYISKFEQALRLRQQVIPIETTGYRLFNGEGDGLPGLVCDLYGDQAVVQFDGQGPAEFWDPELIVNWLLKQTPCKVVINKSRHLSKSQELVCLGGDSNYLKPIIDIDEAGVKFRVNLLEGQKTGFFFDQRDNRHYLREISKNKTVLNLFSYTGGFSINAGLGGAKEVKSIDISSGALELASKNWTLNKLNADQHTSHCEDVFVYTANETKNWDIIVVDPPSMAHSEKQKPKAVSQYIDTFVNALNLLKPGGDLIASSCSSHISFNDFFEILQMALSKVRARGQMIRVSGQAPDHPYPHACPELRYLKFIHLKLV